MLNVPRRYCSERDSILITGFIEFIYLRRKVKGERRKVKGERLKEKGCIWLSEK